MKKEYMQVLHDDIIKLDLKRALKNRIVRDSICSLIIVSLSIIILVYMPEVFTPSYIFKNPPINENIEFLVVFFVSWIVIIGVLFLTIYDIKNLLGISLGKFKVETDTLLHTIDTLESYKTSDKASRQNAMALLEFCKYKNFYFSKRDIFYKWSEAYKMDGYSLLNSSAPGDKFYIVSFNGKTPQVIYNAKMFDYKSEQEQNL